LAAAEEVVLQRPQARRKRVGREPRQDWPLSRVRLEPQPVVLEQVGSSLPVASLQAEVQARALLPPVLWARLGWGPALQAALEQWPVSWSDSRSACPVLLQR